MPRLFFALQPTPGDSVALLEQSAALLQALGAQAYPAANIHATLCFMGAVAPERVDALRSAAAGIVGRAFTLTFDRLEHWEPPRIVCATAQHGHEAAMTLALALAQAVTAAVVAAGFSPDSKPVRAHLTVARKVDGTRAKELAWPRPQGAPLVVHCDTFVLMESRREESGSIYSVVDSWPLYESGRA